MDWLMNLVCVISGRPLLEWNWGSVSLLCGRAHAAAGDGAKRETGAHPHCDGRQNLVWILQFPLSPLPLHFPQLSADSWCLSALPIWALWLNICWSCHCVRSVLRVVTVEGHCRHRLPFEKKKKKAGDVGKTWSSDVKAHNKTLLSCQSAALVTFICSVMILMSSTLLAYSY